MLLKLSIPLVLLVVACTPHAAPPEAGTQTPAAHAASPSPSLTASNTSMRSATTTDARTALDDVVRKGMGYGDFRKQVLALGWEPVVDPQCKANVVGADFEQVCASDPGLCRVCDEMKELSSYSGDAHSLSVFRHPGQQLRLEVFGLGELEYWNVEGDDPGLQVTDWKLVPEAETR